MNVDEFVENKVLPEYRDIVEVIRTCMRTLAPQAEEVISYGIPAYRVKHIIAVISPTKKGVTLAFSNGAAFEDKLGLLEGLGKVSKNLRFKNAAEVDREVIKYYLDQALEFDGR
jgi:uncharacterized protein YdhG (YjbR/CyaY superfamily)